MLHHKFALFFTYTSPHIVLHLDFLLFCNCGWFQLCSIPSPKSENQPSVSTIYWELFVAVIWADPASGFSCDFSPVCCSILPIFFLTFPGCRRATVASHRHIPKEHLLLEERECHECVTHTVVCHGSVVEECWSSAELKRGKPWKPLESHFISWVHRWTLPAVEAS